jgi:hypothetical protein
MSIETRFMFTQGLLKPIQVQAGTLALIEAHKAMLVEVFGLGDDTSQWCWEIRSKLRTRSVPASHRMDRVPVREDDAGLLTDKHVREISCAHRHLVDTVWARIAPEQAGSLGEEPETITVEQAAEFWPVLSLSIEVPFWRWTAEHYHDRMEHAYEVMRGRSSEGEHFDEDPLTIRQANAVIRVFSRWMDEHDVRLEVPNGHDMLKRSDTGGYNWCEHCGAIDEYEVRSEASGCKRGKACPLRAVFSDDEFDEDDAERGDKSTNEKRIRGAGLGLAVADEFNAGFDGPQNGGGS